LDVLEGNYEEAAGKLKDTTEKYASNPIARQTSLLIDLAHDAMIYCNADYGEQTLMLNTLSVKASDMNRNVISGRRNMRYVLTVLCLFS
jgi:hypothetical protein